MTEIAYTIRRTVPLRGNRSMVGPTVDDGRLLDLRETGQLDRAEVPAVAAGCVLEMEPEAGGVIASVDCDDEARCPGTALVGDGPAVGPDHPQRPAAEGRLGRS